MFSNSSVDLPTIDVELSEKCINQMKPSEAAVADQICRGAHCSRCAQSI